MTSATVTSRSEIGAQGQLDSDGILNSKIPCDIRWSPGERFHDLFAAQLDELGKGPAGKKTAVDFGDSKISFAALDAYANRIARFLTARGVVEGDRVALLFDRTEEAYASLLAISKIGAAFVPLDRSFPADRISYIINDSNCRTVLSMTLYSTSFSGLDVDFIALDASIDKIGKLPAARLDYTPTDPDALAYVIYTSGTTGRPKGVQINHSSICNFLRVAKDCYGFSNEDRVYQSLTLAFDYSFEEIWVPLLSGACLVPAPIGVNLVGSELTEFLQDQKITAYCSVPTVLATIEEDLPDLRLLIVSGEACPSDLAKRWAVPGRRMLNVYGPTETCVSATWDEIHPDAPITIGEPLPTYTVVILDPDAPELLARGEVGEIAIAGIGVAGGYINRDIETARAFIPDFLDLPQNPTGMIYRSGDLGKIDETGKVIYLGRADTQVKIRGYRIELEEIEEVAREASGVASVAINPWDGGDGLELVAYFAAPDGEPVDVAAVHQKLTDQLPPYMVPAHFEQIDAMPLQASGKIDRKALPEPSGKRLTETGKEYLAPEEGLEADLAEILCGVLKVERVSADANFFDDLAGDSLIMARYLGAVRKKLKLKKASLALVYQHPSIQELASILAPAPAPATEPEVATPTAPVAVENNNNNNTATATVAATVVEMPLVQEVTGPLVVDGIELAEAPQKEDWEASRGQYIFCGVVQMGYMFLVALFGGVLFDISARWLLASETWIDVYLRSAGIAAMFFFGYTLFFIAVKWLAVGRFTSKEVPLWTMAYVRFWIAQTAIRANPMNLFVGTPVYNLYLRMVGMRVGKGSIILAQPPTCTDLISIGENVLIRPDSLFPGYTAHRGWLRCGPIDIGDNVYIGEQTVLEINTSIGSDSQLGNSSCLQEGQAVPDGEKWHGTPSRKTDVNYNRVEPMNTSPLAGWIYGIASLSYGMLISGPIGITILFLIAQYFLGNVAGFVGTTISLTLVPLYALGLYFLAILTGLVQVFTMPKVYNWFFQEEKTHKLFGVQYYLASSITASSNSVMLQSLFGDSSLIMPYFRGVGYDLSTATQNGSNFGVEQIHQSPFLCKFNRNTLVSDGLYMLNKDYSTTSFRMGAIEVPPDAYLGNDLRYPVGAKVGADCLIATKALLPIEGPVSEGVGILGSPPMEIPRSVARDGRFDHYKKPGVFEERLKMKLKSNLGTLALYMLRNWSATAIVMLAGVWAYNQFALQMLASSWVTSFVVGVLAMGALFFTSFYYIMYERLVTWRYPVKPRICSLYERPFWNHERFWKMNINDLLVVFDGTPLKSVILRAQGVKLGKRVYDNGVGITEPNMVEIGDYCCLNIGSSLQGHSLEDGTFKSDAIKLGDRCTVGISGFVHYGADIGDDVIVDAHSFVMKGSIVGDEERWSGNPAQPTEQSSKTKSAVAV